MHTPGSAEWLASVTEDILEPARPIIDPHHHLWATASRWGRYLLEDLMADTGSGHNIEKTVFIDCGASYRTDGPTHLRPVGETEFVAALAQQSAAAQARDPSKTRIAGIVSFANMMLGEQLDDLLAAHSITSARRWVLGLVWRDAMRSLRSDSRTSPRLRSIRT